VTRILAIANQKGGVGKTTTSVNLAASLAYYKNHVLLVDLDPQGNATMGSGINKQLCDYTTYHFLTNRESIELVVSDSAHCNYHVLPSNGDLVAAEVELMQAPEREKRLGKCLHEVRGNYDYIIIDCPPSLNMLTVNALVASDGVLIPMQCEYFALEGLSALNHTIRKISREVNPRLKIEGILRTMYDPRSSLTNAVSAQLRKYFDDKLYRVSIPRNVRLAEAPSHGKPALAYDRHSKGATAYLALAAEILKKDRKTEVSRKIMESEKYGH
jgi:chromosome partitioning protein